MALADGKPYHEAAAESGVNKATVVRWMKVAEFAEEVDRLTLMTGIALKAERLRVAKRMIRNAKWSKRDVLDWLKYAQGETDGLKLDLTDILAAVTEEPEQMADSRPD